MPGEANRKFTIEIVESFWFIEVKMQREAFKLSAHLPSKYSDWPQVTKGRAGSKPAAVASLWGAL